MVRRRPRALGPGTHRSAARQAQSVGRRRGAHARRARAVGPRRTSLVSELPRLRASSPYPIEDHARAAGDVARLSTTWAIHSPSAVYRLTE
jgi:hypothetical protein